MAKHDESFYGWTITHSTHHDGKPVVEATKPDRVRMGERGEVGIDPEIMVQRLKPRLLAQDVVASSPDDRGLWQERLREAEDARDDARVVRVQRAQREAQRAERQGERG